MNKLRHLAAVLLLSLVALPLPAKAELWTVYQGKEGPGRGKHIVFLAGDEEYRSEEGLPMMAKILAVRHGFKCTVLYSINPVDGTIDPVTLTNTPGLEKLATADLCFMSLRFRELPDAQGSLGPCHPGRASGGRACPPGRSRRGG